MRNLIPLLADGARLELARIQSMSEWWHWLLLAAVVGGVLAAVAILYYYDSVELPRATSWLLAALRILAFGGVLLYFLDLEKRTEQEVVNNSRVLLLLDTSQSMALRDADPKSPGRVSRIEQVAAELAGGKLIARLRSAHDVVTYRFDQGSAPIQIASFPKLADPARLDDAARASADQQSVSRRQEGGRGGVARPEPQIDWKEQLNPGGLETRLGDALRRLVDQERGGPVAGIVLFSDGRSNAGVEYTAGADAAQQAGIPVFTVGLGSDRPPVNARVVDLEAPPRVYPGDDFRLTAYIQAHGLAGRTANVQLLSAPLEAAGSVGRGQPAQERSVTLAADGQLLPVRFEAAPKEEGRRVYTVRVAPLHDEQDGSDNQRSAEVQVVQRKNRVLLFAGGPTREYRFVRNLLYRDRDTIVDVLLQSGQAGMSQEANQLVDKFPERPDDLFQYDAIVAFDPDWLALNETQIELLDRWVSEQAGGLIVSAGPVHTPQWATEAGRDRRVDTVRGLYPVLFYSGGSATLNAAQFGGETPWPLQFTRDGREAEFLRLEDDAQRSEQAWASLAGVYGHYAVKGPKPGARVYAAYCDPDAAIDKERPIYFAGHFYGAGRVFFQASGEMWRLRSIDESYFDRFYTKLIRWVSQGRLLRDSSRGLLLVEKDRCLLGDQIVVRAILTDARHEPLTDEEAAATLIHPGGARSTLTLRKVADSPREGMYSGQFTALAVGNYRLEMTLPGGGGDELLSREVRARMPDREVEQPERNDALMKDIANKTAGQYYAGVASAMNPQDGRAPLVNVLEPQDQVTSLPGTPDKDFERRWMTWLMGCICGALCLEWLIRRLSKLA